MSDLSKNKHVAGIDPSFKLERFKIKPILFALLTKKKGKENVLR